MTVQDTSLTIGEAAGPAVVRGRGAAIRRFAGLLLTAAWLALAIALAWTRGPWSNEAWSAIPAVNLIQHGTMATTVLEFRNTWLRGLDRHTYWLMPFHILVQAAWYKLVGFSLFKQRLLSVLFAAVLLGAWYRIVVRLTGLRAAALSTCVILGFEGHFLNGAANGRMDMMCASLGSAAIASWLELRIGSPRAALLVAHSLAAAAIFTHPCGVFYCGALLLISLSMSNWRMRWTDLAIMAAPYLAAAALWAPYIAQAPSDFRAQFFGNASGFAGEYSDRTRWGGLFSPGRAILDEVRLRYLKPFGVYALGSRPGTMNATWLLIAAPAAAGSLLLPRLRRRPGVRILCAAAVLVFLMMALLEGMKYPYYLIYPLPFLCALAAITGAVLWNHYRRLRVALAACLFLATVPQIRLVTNVIRLNPLHNELGVVADYLRSNRSAGQVVVGGAELGYLLGFNATLRDDVRLGYYTGLRPEFVVTTGWYRLWFEAARSNDPAVHRYIESLLAHKFHLELTRGQYSVYRRSEP